MSTPPESSAPIPLTTALPEPDPAHAIVAPEAGLANRTVRGLMWVIANTFLSKGLAFVSFVVLGLALTEEDFGVYAFAFAFASFAQAFRDGGVTFLLPQRGEKEYPDIAGPVFWMATAFNLGVAAFLTIAAVLASTYAEDYRFPWILWIMAAAVAIASPSTVFNAILQMRLRFDAASRIGIASSLVRNGGIIALAIAGAGPLSLVIPLLGVAVVEGTMGYLATREKPWLNGPKFARWRELFRASKWLILTMGAAIAINQGAYLALGLIAPSRVVGLFFFAYQLVLQVDTILNFPVQYVLLGSFSSIKDHAERQSAAAIRAVRALSLIAAPATVGLAVVAAPFEMLIWGGKWAESVFAIQVIALACAWRIIFAVPGSVAQSRGLWRFNATLLISGGAITIGAVMLGAAIRPNTDVAGIAMALSTILGIGGLYVLGMRRLGITPRASIGAVLRCWLIAVIAAGITAAIQELAEPWLIALGDATNAVGQRFGREIGGWIGAGDALRAKVETRTGTSVQAAVELLLIGALFSKLFLIGLRIGAPGAVRDALSLAPARIRSSLERLLMIRAR